MKLHRYIARDGLFQRLPYFNNEAGTYRAEVRLFRAVIDRAILDCVHEDENIRKEAFDFFFNPGPDTEKIAAAAQLDYDFLLQYAKKAIELLEEDVDDNQSAYIIHRKENTRLFDERNGQQILVSSHRTVLYISGD